MVETKNTTAQNAGKRSGNLEKYEALMVETKNTMARNAEVLADHTAKIRDREDGVVAKGVC